MKKTNKNQRVRKQPESRVNQFLRQNKSLCLIIGVLMFIGFVTAVTVITDTNVNSPTGTYVNISADRINEVLYVQAGNGSDIQATIDKANDGDKIILEKGNYTITSSIILNKSVIFEGYGNESVIYGNGDFFMMQVEAKVILRNFQMDMNNPTTNQRDNIRLGAEANDSIIENLILRDSTRAGIFSSAQQFRLLINKVQIYNAGLGTNEGRGIWINADNSVITNSYIENSSRYGIELQNAKYITARDNFINGARRTDGSSGRGYFLVTCEHCDIIGGRVTNSALTGINLAFGSNYSTVRGVRFDNIHSESASESRGIEIQDGTHNVLIEGNYIINITNGTDSNFGVGIFIESGDNNTIENNYIEDTEIGIKFATTVDGVRVENNRFFNVNQSYSMNRQSYYGWQWDENTRRVGLGNNNPNVSLDIMNEPSPYIRLQDDGGNSFDAGGIMFKEDRTNSAQYEFRIRHNGADNELIIEDDDEKFLTIGRFDNSITFGNGTEQYNITLTSPDGTEFTCGVNNSGSFLCS